MNAVNPQSFCVALGSTISPSELALAGFHMQDFRFLPASFEEVCQRLKGYTVTDESTPFKTIYRID